MTKRSYRVGEAHPRSVLTEAEIDQMIEDRGPEEAPRMSYTKLSIRYGISKSCVRDILTGRRRGRISAEGQVISKVPQQKRVRINMVVSLSTRAKIHRMGGGKWLEKIVAEAVKARAHHENMRTADNASAKRFSNW